MKTTTMIALISLVLAGCGLLNSKGGGSQNLTATFSLTDTTGKADTTFRSGQQFMMSFLLVNTTPDTIIYYSVFCNPSVIFGIFRNDTEIVGSPAGCDNLIGPNYFKPGDTLRGQWEAPNSYEGLVILPPGSYAAKVVFPNLGEIKGVSPVTPLSFSVIK